jgi:hypothetical protein
MSSATPLIWPEASDLSQHTHHRILMLSYYYPPCEATGARRADGLHLWLPKFGWEPALLTAEWGVGKRGVVEVPHRGPLDDLRDKLQARSKSARVARPSTGSSSLAELGQSMQQWYDAHMGWSAKVVREAVARNQKRRIDLVWATCTPFPLAYAAQQLASALRCPYVVDLREPLPEHLASASPRHWLLNAVANASAVTIASPACATPTLARVRKNFPPICILGGTWHREAACSRQASQFILLHAGTLHKQARDPELLFEALAALAQEIPDFRRDTRVRFIGEDSHYASLAPAYKNVADMCELAETLPNAEVQQEMQDASVLLIINGTDERYAEPITGKFFDYLPFEAPILSIGGTAGLPSELLGWTGAGAWAGTVETITAAIRALYLAWKASGIVRAPRDMDALAFLSQRRMAGEFAELFNAIGEHRDLILRGILPWTGDDANRQFTDGLSYKPMSMEE